MTFVYLSLLLLLMLLFCNVLLVRQLILHLMEHLTSNNCSFILLPHRFIGLIICSFTVAHLSVILPQSWTWTLPVVFHAHFIDYYESTQKHDDLLHSTWLSFPTKLEGKQKHEITLRVWNCFSLFKSYRGNSFGERHFLSGYHGLALAMQWILQGGWVPVVTSGDQKEKNEQ